jgi:hypothetical protein
MQMKFQTQFLSQRRALTLCLFAALWFALSPALKVLLAHAAGKQIEIVVCTGSGLKKIYVTTDSTAHSGHETSLKHCSNTPLAVLLPSFGAPVDLAYAAPQTPSSLQAVHAPQAVRNWVLNGWPPPGRAPPALS